MLKLLKFLQESGVKVNSVEEMLNLEKLYLSGINLTTLPKEIGNLINLKELNLSNNRLSTLPKEIGNLINLKKLGLGFNILTTLPSEIGNLVNLKELGLGINNLTTLPAEFGNLTSLNYIGLSHNNFTNLPLGIDKLSKDLFPDYLHKYYDESVKFRKAVKIIERAWMAYDWIPNSEGIARCALRSFRELQESNPEIFS